MRWNACSTGFRDRGHADGFVLKGGMLLMTWFDEPFRAARDLDFLGYGNLDRDIVQGVFSDIFDQEQPDGVLFDSSAMRVSPIREENEYGGFRIRTTASIDGARNAATVDIGIGEATEPSPEWLDYPALLDDMPRPRLRGYAMETVIAEKFQAMVALGEHNTRLKDYYDLWILNESFPLDRERLAEALAATFLRRRTALPTRVPDGLSTAFAQDPVRTKRWETFRQNLSTDPGSLEEVVEAIGAFIMPVAAAAARNHDVGPAPPAVRDSAAGDVQNETNDGLPTPFGDRRPMRVGMLSGPASDADLKPPRPMSRRRPSIEACKIQLFEPPAAIRR